MWSKYQVYTYFVSLLLLIVNLVFTFNLPPFCSLCKNRTSKMNVCLIFSGIAKLPCKCMVGQYKTRTAD